MEMKLTLPHPHRHVARLTSHNFLPTQISFNIFQSLSKAMNQLQNASDRKVDEIFPKL